MSEQLPPNTTQEEVEDEQELQEPGQQGPTKLSKNQKKKLKEKEKKDQEKNKAEPQADAKGDVQEQKVEEADNKEEDAKDKKKKKDGKKPTGAAILALKAAEKRRLEEEEYERAKKAFEEEQKRLEEIEKEQERLKEEEKKRHRQIKLKEKEQLKAKGLYLSKKQKGKLERTKLAKQYFQKQKYDSEDDDSDDEEDSASKEKSEGNTPQQPITVVEAEAEVKTPATPAVPAVAADIKSKKKFVKKKEKTLEEIYEEALKKKQQAEKSKQSGSVETWQQLAEDAKPQEKPEQKEVPKPEEIKVEETQAQTKEREKKDKRRKKKENDIDANAQVKKEGPQLQILVDQKKYFNVSNEEKYRAPICCILGHVDTGKTSILDKIRRTSVQQNQAGGITQQIGATFFPKDKLLSEISKCDAHYHIDTTVPGLLIIDTPGHESFSNLRSRGSSLCDIAILVIDLMHGLEKQTLESIKMLTDRGTHFVVALNKIDRCVQWVSHPDESSFVSIKNQSQTTISDYKNRLDQVKLELNQEGFNIDMYWQNTDITEYVSLIPTSAKTGEGLPDLMSALVKECMSIPSIQKRLRINNKKFNCTVMEVKMLEGHGTTIDCILVDGVIHKNDTIVLLGFNGPIVTKVKALLTPHPMKEMRVKDEYIHHEFIQAANGIKIDAPNIDEAVAGTPLFVANTPDEVDRAIDLCNNEYLSVKNKIKLSDMGVGVAASTLGSLEALLDYLNTQKIPVSHVSVGPVSREDVMKAMKSLLSQNPEKRRKEFCCVLVFDVKILEDAKKFADENNIRVFSADIIYHLTDHFNKFVKEIREERKAKEGKDAIFPCVLKIVEVFRKSGPMVLGVDVEEGVLKVGTPIAVYNKEESKLKIGVVQNIESNHKKLKEARKATGSVAISLVGEKAVIGKDFQQTDKLCSLISRRSIDCLKEHFRDDVNKDEWGLVIELKKYFKIQ